MGANLVQQSVGYIFDDSLGCSGLQMVLTERTMTLSMEDSTLDFINSQFKSGCQ